MWLLQLDMVQVGSERYVFGSLDPRRYLEEKGEPLAWLSLHLRPHPVHSCTHLLLVPTGAPQSTSNGSHSAATVTYIDI